MKPFMPWMLRLVALCLAGLVWGVPGCGGGAGMVAAVPGTGGTGFTSTGAITGFGSVKVNGVFYDDTQASVRVDGQSQTSAALALGMLVTVQGQLDVVAGTGSATSIDTWSQAQGSVTSVGTNSFQVAGMNVGLDNGTVYLGVATGSALRPGMGVRVWALATDAGLAQWLALRVEVLPVTPASTVTTGVVGATGTQLNGLSLSGGLTPLVAGQSVRVDGTLAGSNLAVKSVQVLPAARADSSSDEEVEGVVSQVTAAGHFLLGSMPVDASQAVLSGGSSVAVGAKAEVTGRWNGGVFQASSVQLESVVDLTKVEIRGDISAFVSLADFTVRGQRCDASGVSQLGGGKLSDLKVGVRVKLLGVKQGDIVRVTSISLSES